MLVIAHRGASDELPENTLPAFERAIEVGADYVEFDVHATAAGDLVVTHDPPSNSVLRARRGAAKRSSRHGSRGPQNTSNTVLQAQLVPRLEEVLDLCRGRIGVMVELKTPYRYRRHDVVRRTLALLDDDAVIVCFEAGAIALVGELRPGMRTVQHVAFVPMRVAAARGCWAVGIENSRATPQAFARALAIEPRVLLLDEPLSALDAKVRVQLREEIRRIQLELGITTLYVTHDQEEALSVSDHVAVMNAGHIEQMGTPADMYSTPATPFVAEFIGTMNRLESTVIDGSRGEVDHRGKKLVVDAARGRRSGEHVLVLVRPESLQLEASGDGASGENTLSGDVVTHTFLGPVTRLKIVGPDADLIADMATARAATMPVGQSVVAHVPSEGTRLLSLEEPAAPDQDGR